MTYIYDIVLNFHHDYYEFYEWDNNDDLLQIKKIALMRINCNDFNNILNKKVLFDDSFLLNIFHKCEYFENKKIISIPYSVIFTDSYRTVAIMIDLDNNIIKYSSLTLEDEEDVIFLGEKIGITKVKYQILGDNNNINNYKTRKELEMISYIKDDILESYNKKNVEKLKYLYSEYFDIKSNNIEKIKKDLEEELTKDIGEKHFNLYRLIKLSRCQKGV